MEKIIRRGSENSLIFFFDIKLTTEHPYKPILTRVITDINTLTVFKIIFPVLEHPKAYSTQKSE